MYQVFLMLVTQKKSSFTVTQNSFSLKPLSPSECLLTASKKIRHAWLMHVAPDVCAWTSVTKRTQGFCNNLAHQLIDRAKISSMFSCILARGPRAHHTARANEALYDEARKMYLQTSSWVLVCTAGLVTLYAIFMSPCFCLFGSDRCHVQLQTKQTRISLESRLAPEPLEVNLPMIHEAVLDFQRISRCEMDA